MIVDMKFRQALLILFIPVAVAGVGGVLYRDQAERMALGTWQRLQGMHTVEERIAQYGPAVRGRLLPRFQAAGVAYPPAALTLVGLKDEKRLEVWASDAGGPMRLVASYPILGASGELGPKLREGDRQVPEGLYRITGLNPNSSFHLSLQVGYPNDFDWARAREEGRNQPGTDIFIHGKQASVGCLAMGDAAAEDLFVLAEETGLEAMRVILAPVDFRVRELPLFDPELPPWTTGLYADIRAALDDLVP